MKLEFSFIKFLS